MDITNDAWLENLAEPEVAEVNETSFEPQYESVDIWLTDWLLPLAAPRSTHGSFCWCEEWYRHPDVGARLAALWLAWEQAFAEPDDNEGENGSFDSLSNRNHWWVYHYANQELYIFGERSSMRRCEPGTHKPLQEPYQAKTRSIAIAKKETGIVS